MEINVKKQRKKKAYRQDKPSSSKLGAHQALDLRYSP